MATKGRPDKTKEKTDAQRAKTKGFRLPEIVNSPENIAKREAKLAKWEEDKHPICKWADSNLKYPEEMVMDLAADIVLWFVEHPNSTAMIRYWMDPDTNPTMPWLAFKRAWKNYDTTKNLMSIVKELQESNLANQALLKRIDSTMARFLLCNNHGYSNKIDQKVEVTNTDVTYTFGNSILNEEDEDAEIIENENGEEEED